MATVTSISCWERRAPPGRPPTRSGAAEGGAVAPPALPARGRRPPPGRRLLRERRGRGPADAPAGPVIAAAFDSHAPLKLHPGRGYALNDGRATLGSRQVCCC